MAGGGAGAERPIKRRQGLDEDGNGVYAAEVRYLAPGTYPVDLVAPAGVTVETDVAFPLDMVVASGGMGEASVFITSATAD